MAGELLYAKSPKITELTIYEKYHFIEYIIDLPTASPTVSCL